MSRIRRAASARRHAIRIAAGLVLALPAAGWPVAGAAAPPTCEAPQGFGGQRRLESPDVVVIYRTVPAVIEVSRPFVVEAVVCPAQPAGAASGLLVDAYMPAHRHGMNYRPRVSRKDDGTYVAEGLLFHMPGQWQLRFDVERGGRTERLSHDIDLQ
jgi:hypothetical protein